MSSGLPPPPDGEEDRRPPDTTLFFEKMRQHKRRTRALWVGLAAVCLIGGAALAWWIH